VARPPSPPLPATKSHSGRTRYPHHVWMFDITEIPGLLRLFSFKLAVVFDVLSRSPLVARVFLAEPSAVEIGRLFSTAVRRFGAPRHSVSDQGPQFTAEIFQARLARHGVRHRYGAIGWAGSIALIERFFRTLKSIGALRARPPLLRDDLERRLDLAFGYYLWLRPHRGLDGATPAECMLGLRPAHLDAVPPPRGRPGEAVEASPPFELRYLGPDRSLPCRDRAGVGHEARRHDYPRVDARPVRHGVDRRRPVAEAGHRRRERHRRSRPAVLAQVERHER